MVSGNCLLTDDEIPYSSIPEGNSPFDKCMLRFADFHARLLAYLRSKVRSGELTERGLARMTGISQPHIHNVLKGKKLFSVEVSDTILRELELDLLDLVQPAEFKRYAVRVNYILGRGPR